MDAGTWRGIFTVVMLLLFIGICFWAWSSRRKDDFAEAEQLPLQDGVADSGKTGSGDDAR